MRGLGGCCSYGRLLHFFHRALLRYSQGGKTRKGKAEANDQHDDFFQANHRLHDNENSLEIYNQKTSGCFSGVLVIDLTYD